MVVAIVCLVALLSHLLGTGPTAVTAIHEEADTRWADWGSFRAGAGPLTVLSPVVGFRGSRLRYEWCNGGIQGDSLEEMQSHFE